MWKAQEWGGMYQRYKNINLNKIQRSDERVSQVKGSLERHNDSLQNKRSQIRCIPHGSLGSKKRAGWQNLKTWKNSKKGPKIRWGLAQCKSTCKDHAGFDKSFENITLCLDQLPLNSNHKGKENTETLVLSREANALPHCKNLSVKPYSLISCCFKHNL